jgi:hypothetical protein
MSNTTPTRSASEVRTGRGIIPRLRFGLVWQAVLLTSVAPAAAPAPLEFIVHTADGGNFTGPLQKLAADGAIRLGGSSPAVIPGVNVVTVRRADLRLPGYPENDVVVLTHGDRVPFDPRSSIKLEDGRVTFQSLPALREQPLSIPRAFVALVWLQAPAALPDPELAIRHLVAGKRVKDVVLLRNGDQVEGTVTAIEPIKGVHVDVSARRLVLPLSQVAGIAFNTELAARIRLPKTCTHLVLANSGRLSFAALQLEGGKLRGKTLFGARVEVPLAEAASLETRGERVVYLSDLKPRSFQHTSFAGVSWPLTRDTAVTGRPLRLAGNTYDKGLGVHAKSIAVYDLNGKFRWLEAVVGLDQRTGRLGRVRVKVLVDGKEQALGPDRELTGKDAPLAVRVNVERARELTLVVDFGSYGDVQAHVDWADARLLR